jgi:hypothetical protein
MDDHAPSGTPSSQDRFEAPTGLYQEDAIIIADEPDVIELSSGSEVVDSEESEGEEDDISNADTTMDGIADEELVESSSPSLCRLIPRSSVAAASSRVLLRCPVCGCPQLSPAWRCLTCLRCLRLLRDLDCM